MEKKVPFILNGSIYQSSNKKTTRELYINDKCIQVPLINNEVIEIIKKYNHDSTSKLHTIINFLYTVGQRWKSEEYSRRRTYIRNLVTFLGYSEQMAKLEANWISMILCSKSALYDIITNDLGSRHIIDEWIPQDECYIKAFPKGKSVHLLAGNVPLSGITSIIRALLTKNQCIIKMSSSDPFTPTALAMSFIDVSPTHPITRSLSIIYWSHSEDVILASKIMDEADVVIAWGGENSIKWAVKHTPAHIDILKFGPKKSLSIIDNPDNLTAAASGVAHDVCFYDQQACFSTQNVYFIGENFYKFKKELRSKLELYSKILPKGKQDFESKAAFSLAERECLFAGYDVQVGEQKNWMIVESPMDVLTSQPLGRCVYIHHVLDIQDACNYINKYTTQTVSIYPWKSSFKYRDKLAYYGVERIVESGMNNIFRVGGAHDTMRPLQRLVRFVSQERPFDFTTKDVAVEIEQTKFLEEDKFLVFVP
ncbi:acyl-CoA reductase luxC [Candidatus Photodesmus katoptron]|uniref:Acyl-CoA reductase n=1 Tax=Candidatus Photodesmus katoptron Akat1 TaxID=1236703 RepID=S3DGB3_9GAMM|nr:acyl-CoA reductase [Candidatus Photodesmus katoptron]EPE37472.1 acyl-CoA reductase LuxC [Candidatus Photodesmus katoptron Akat1]KEY90301.1 acyl-CoA reductase luxC [Candidatus Photodesmus katoptron]